MLEQTAVEIANEVRMHAVGNGMLFLLVEGETDERLYAAIFDLRGINTIAARGWERVVEAIGLLDASGFTRCLGIIDRDYHGVATPAVGGPNIIVTDDRDSEVALIKSNALDRIFDEYGSGPKIALAGGMNAIRDRLFESAFPLAKLRFLSAIKSYGFSLRECEFKKFTDKKTLEVDSLKMIAHLRGKNAVNAILAMAHFDEAERELTKQVPPLSHDRICRGHDMFQLAALGLSSLWGNNSINRLSGEELEKKARLACPVMAMRATRFGCDVVAWFAARGRRV